MGFDTIEINLLSLFLILPSFPGNQNPDIDILVYRAVASV